MHSLFSKKTKTLDRISANKAYAKIIKTGDDVTSVIELLARINEQQPQLAEGWPEWFYQALVMKRSKIATYFIQGSFLEAWQNDIDAEKNPVHPVTDALHCGCYDVVEAALALGFEASRGYVRSGRWFGPFHAVLCSDKYSVYNSILVENPLSDQQRCQWLRRIKNELNVDINEHRRSTHFEVSVLYFALEQRQSSAVISTLIELGAEVPVDGPQAVSLLHISPTAETTKVLLDAGVNPLATDQQGDTVAFYRRYRMYDDNGWVNAGTTLDDNYLSKLALLQTKGLRLDGRSQKNDMHPLEVMFNTVPRSSWFIREFYQLIVKEREQCQNEKPNKAMRLANLNAMALSSVFCLCEAINDYHNELINDHRVDWIVASQITYLVDELDLTTPSHDGRTFLMNDQREIFRAMRIAKMDGINMLVKDNEGDTFLHHYCKYQTLSDTSVNLKRMISYLGSDEIVLERNNRKQIPLHVLLIYLNRHGVRKGATAKKRTASTREFLSYDGITQLSMNDDTGNQALHLACRAKNVFGLVAIIEYLIDTDNVVLLTALMQSKNHAQETPFGRLARNHSFRHKVRTHLRGKAAIKWDEIFKSLSAEPESESVAITTNAPVCTLSSYQQSSPSTGNTQKTKKRRANTGEDVEMDEKTPLLRPV